MNLEKRKTAERKTAEKAIVMSETLLARVWFSSGFFWSSDHAHTIEEELPIFYSLNCKLNSEQLFSMNYLELDAFTLPVG